MAVFFHSSDSDVNIEVGEYQEFPRHEGEVGEEDAAAETTPKPKSRYRGGVLLSFGLLCVVQAVLNITLRLIQSEPADKGETENGSCLLGWQMFESSCYYISSQRRSWDASRRDCVRRDADLVIIDSREEQDFLLNLTTAAWVGMTDREEEGTWIWVDGTPVDKDGLLWAPGQPDGAHGGEDCGDLRNMVNFIGLNDYVCRDRNRWICEKTLWYS